MLDEWQEPHAQEQRIVSCHRAEYKAYWYGGVVVYGGPPPDTDSVDRAGVLSADRRCGPSSALASSSCPGPPERPVGNPTQRARVGTAMSA